MTPHEKIIALRESGRMSECAAAVHDLLGSADEQERCAGALFAISYNFYSEFAAAVAILKPLFPALKADFNICAPLAYAAWAANDAELCSAAARQCIILNPKDPAGYLRLGVLKLGQQEFREAVSSLSAGIRNCPGSADQMRGWLALAESKVKGIEEARLKFDGEDFIFELATFNGHAMEASLTFLAGALCEAEELRFARRFVQRCETVLEVGASVGNHAVYFAKTFGPKNVYVFDALPAAARQTERNLRLNGLDRNGVNIVVRNAIVGARGIRKAESGSGVECVCLDDEVLHKVDFIKIDVDGMEMEVLEGCRRIISRDRPKMMVEVSHALENAFRDFVGRSGYAIMKEIARDTDTNFFIGPASGAGQAPYPSQ